MTKVPKICIPIQPKTTREVLDFMQQNENQADLFEIWLDQIQDLSLSKFFEHKKKPLLFVCKGEKEKGNFQGTEKEKVELLKKTIDLGADYIDLDYQTEVKFLQYLIQNKKQTKICLSYHNFELTPDLKNLLGVIQKMLKNKPDIVKIATMANSYKDAIVILTLAQSLEAAKIPFITIAMGKYGKITRVMTPLLGGEMMFAPLESIQETAGGQIEVARLRELWQEFGN